MNPLPRPHDKEKCPLYEYFSPNVAYLEVYCLFVCFLPVCWGGGYSDTEIAWHHCNM